VTKVRLRTIQLVIPIFAGLIIARLFYWQVVRADFLTSRAFNQHQQVVTLSARRGSILASDQSVLAGTADNFMLFAYKPQLEASPLEVSKSVAPIIAPAPEPATDSAQPFDPIAAAKVLVKDTEDYLLERLNQNNSWVSLKHYLNREQKEMIESLELKGLGFESQLIRFYPESSMSAQLLGFVGQDINGQATGYFGLEGYYDRQLQGQAGKVEQELDAQGNPILVGSYANLDSKNGRTLLTTINRGVQYQVEKLLKLGLERYGASAGTVIVMDPDSGGIIAMASYPNYDPSEFYKYPKDFYANPAVANLFEPGSIFKPIVMAAAIDDGAVEPETKCDICSGKIHIGSYSIGTWNDEYHPETTMTEAIINSDNTGMVFAARKLGSEKLRAYLAEFGLGNKTGIDLQEETSGVLRELKDWKEIDLATTSFGQGIAMTPIQVTAAINAIANDGTWVQPYIVETIIDGQRQINTHPHTNRQVISPESAEAVTQMMIAAVVDGEAKWAKPKHLSVAGKTGTAQIPVAGHYDKDKTITSFVGFSPADSPRFTMLVSLREPQTSQWGSETAAPLWFEIAKQISLML
jgi:cell division protein FtsI/penicillin-binding protein 2